MYAVMLTVVISLSRCLSTAQTSDDVVNNIAFDLADIIYTDDTVHGQYHLEGFRSINNYQILREEDVPRKSELVWVSIGRPALVKTTAFGNFTQRKFLHTSRSGLYVYISMLTDEHRRKLAEMASRKYRIEITDDQIVNLILTKFDCSLALFDDLSASHVIVGSVRNFRTFPLKLQFDVPPNSIEHRLVDDLVQVPDESLDISFDCKIASAGKKLLTNTLSITSRQTQQIGLQEKLFGPSSTAQDQIFVTREQTNMLSREIYSTLDILEDYEMAEFTFSEAFVSGFIQQTAQSNFFMQPIDQVLSSLSSYGLDISGDLQPDVVKKDLGSILKIEQYGNKSRIITDEAFSEHDSINVGMNYKTGVSGFGVSGSVEAGFSFGKTSESSGRTLDDQLTELNTASKDHIEWEIQGTKVVPKSLNVARLMRAKFNQTLKFSRVRIQKQDTPFRRNFELGTRHINNHISEIDLRVDNITAELASRLEDHQRSFDTFSRKQEHDVEVVKSSLEEIRRTLLNYDNYIHECPDGFTKVPSAGCYKVLTEKLPWNNASDGCTSLHSRAHLVVIDSYPERQALDNYLHSITGNQLKRICGDGWCLDQKAIIGFWTSGQRVYPNSESRFYWVNPIHGLKTMTYTNWGRGQPDFYDGKESCMLMCIYALGDYTWNDVPCSARRCSICEVDIQP